jgi:signal transduction histidine kinase
MIPVLDLAIRALSFFNTIALVWLGLTVLLNAERRTWGTWLAGFGLVLGGAFFAGHSTVVGREFGTFEAEMEFWWRLGWVPFVSPPYLWYLAMAWYSGVLGTRKHRAAIVLTSLVGSIMLVALFLNPLPSYHDLSSLAPGTTLSLGGIRLMVLAYPLYSSLCISLALIALWRPAAPQRFMGELARRRARPWLAGASLVLLAVSLSVELMAAWFVLAVQSGQLTLFTIPTLTLIKAFDFVVSGLLSLAIVLVGRAMAGYEIFTGKTLPRGGLAHQWRNSLILAAAFGLLIGASLQLTIHPVYQLLLLALLTTLLYALHSWRVFVDRERSIERLRPFVASEHLYDRLLHATLSPETDTVGPFRALCKDVLDAHTGYLVPLGPLATLATRTLSYPDDCDVAEPLVESFRALAPQLRSPQVMCTAIDPDLYGGAVWAIPLWSERGLIGLLLLGEKEDGSLYNQEEMEIARAAGERLIDVQASSEMARRLVFLQRQRLAESQVLDRRARQVLHDDVLPRLHTAMLTLTAAQNGSAGPAGDAAHHLAEAHREIANLLREIPTSVAPQVARLGLIGTLHEEVTSTLAPEIDEITWRVAPEAERVAASISPLTAEVLFGAAREAIRNAARYARNGDSSRPLRLTISLTSHHGLQLTVEDDGVGVGHAAPAPEGRGQGLALHSTLMAVIGGSLSVESVPQQYTRVVLSLPERVAL